MPSFSEKLVLPYASISKYTVSLWKGENDNGSSSGKMTTSLADVKQVNAVPDWKLKIARRQDATGAYFRRSIFSNIPNNFTTAVGKDVAGTYSLRSYCINRDTQDPSLYVNEANDNALRDQALKRIKDRISGRSSQVNLLIPLVELRELRGVIKAVAFSSIDIMKALIEIKRTKGKSAAQYASHAWLNWSFGIAPTISEANSILSSIDSFIMNHSSDVVRDAGSATKQWMSQHEYGTVAPNGCTSVYKVSCLHELGYRFACGYTPALRPGNDYTLEEHFGLNFGSMVPAAWELTPFSWVFDYFTTMGAFLEDTFVSSSVNTNYVSETKRYSCTGQTFLKNTPSPAFNLFVDSSGRGQRFNVKTLTRTPHAALPRRSLRFNTGKEISGVGEDGIQSLADVEKAVKRVLNLGSILIGGKAFSNRID